MDPNINIEKIIKPFKVFLGFDKLIDQYEESLSSDNEINRDIAKIILSKLKFRDELYHGIQVDDNWVKYAEDIHLLIEPLFPSALQQNEIKIAIPPISPRILRCTDRYRAIFKDISVLYSNDFLGQDEDAIYITMCSFILSTYYGIQLKSKIPPVYPVKNEDGIIQYFKSAYNADFMSIIPIGTPPKITKDIVKKLEDNIGNIDTWKAIFPPESWEVHGFGILSFMDVSSEEALSLMKNNLIGDLAKTDKERFDREASSYLGTLLNVAHINTSFTMFNSSTLEFVNVSHANSSCAMNGVGTCDVENMFCKYAYDLIFNQKSSFIMSDLDTMDDSVFETPMYRRMKEQGIRSFVMSPVYNGEELLGIMEFTSETPGAFRAMHISKIKKLLPLATTAILKMNSEQETEKAYVIQKEFTSIDPSVEWKFEQEAENYIQARDRGEEYNIDNIIFHDLIALYGQMDIAGSSRARNEAIAADLKTQMKWVSEMIDLICSKIDMPLLSSIRYQIGIINEKLSSDLAAGMEQEVVEFLKESINPLFEQIKLRDTKLENAIDEYFARIADGMDIAYDKRKDYDDTVRLINMHLSGQLDKAEAEAQEIYPHYFERYKTDGVEHNIFIGQEISPHIPYHKLYLDNLRLWQLKTLCQLEIEHNIRKKKYPLPLDIATLIMIYSNPLSIKYRMDEKQFDVDGAYNARYEIIKKRIDKAHIKGTDERITQPGKIVMIYTQSQDYEEYMNHINFLTYEGYLVGEPEVFDIEDLQGIVGLRGIRVAVNYNKDIKEQKLQRLEAKMQAEVEMV